MFGYIAPPVLELLWSPDSKHLLTHLIDTRKVKTAPALVQHVPTDGSTRPTLFNAERKVAFPGDKDIETWQFLSIDVASGQLQKADCAPCPMVYPLYQGYFETGRGWWDANSRHAYLLHQQIDRTQTQLLKWDTQTGDISAVIAEDPAMDFAAMPTSHVRTFMKPLPDSGEVIWYSERSGWAHLYLYDVQTGELKNTLTQGEWLVRGLLHFDAVRRELFIQTANRAEGRNPYYGDICRVNIDTGELTTVVASDHDYAVQDQRYTSSEEGKGVAPSGDYIVTTRSRIDDVPVSLLLDRDGNEVLVLETADTSAMPDAWQWPERVMLKGADDKTDIYGIIFRPSDFSPDKTYPIIDLSWGHSPPVTPFTGGWDFFGALAWAELGFIAVNFGNRGGGLRDKAFHDDIDPALPHYNKADCVAGIQQLAQRYPYMDSSRVGVASSLYPGALTGLLIYPEFYKVGVDINPMSDARLMPQLGNFGGGLKYPPHEDFANKLRGKLLLIHGMMEDVVLVASTFRLVEALQKAHKNFDMLLLPNVDHLGPMDYATKRSWDYLVTHLLGEEPPEDFELRLSDL